MQTPLLKIDPEMTPEGVSLDEIRQITQRDADGVRLFHVQSAEHIVHIVALSTVYFSDHFGDSRYFASRIPDFVHGRFLEIGAGTGVVTIATILRNSLYFKNGGAKYLVIDLNPVAVRNVSINTMINGVEEYIEARCGDVFQPLNSDEKFGCIFWNHPFHIGNAIEDIIQRACFDPMYNGLTAFIRDGFQFLEEGGRLLLGSGNFAELKIIRSIVSEHQCEMILLDFVYSPFDATAGDEKTFNIYEILKKAS
jgi:16S rRNA G1207 methylase RsmC